MRGSTGSCILLLICTGLVWSLVLLQTEPSGPASAIGGGLMAMVAASLGLVIRPSTWLATQQAVDRHGLWVVYVPAAAAFLLGVAIIEVAGGALQISDRVAPPSLIIGAGALAGLPFIGWPVGLYQLHPESEATAPHRHAAAAPSPGPSLRIRPWNPATEATGVFNYRGRLTANYEATPGLGLVVGRLHLRFVPEEAAVVQPCPESAAAAPILIEGGAVSATVPFEVAVHSRHHRVAPRSARITVPENTASETLRINLLDPSADAADGEVVLIEVLQAERRVQLMEFALPASASGAENGTPLASDGGDADRSDHLDREPETEIGLGLGLGLAG